MNKKFIISVALLCLGTTMNIAARADNPPRSGEVIFNQACASCHATHFPNAPQAHDTEAWQKKYAISAAQAKASGATTMTVLVAKVRNGNHAMPPKGLCNDCTDQEYKNAIEFMSSAKK